MSEPETTREPGKPKRTSLVLMVATVVVAVGGSMIADSPFPTLIFLGLTCVAYLLVNRVLTKRLPLWFKFHLSTGVMSMFVAGMFLWANIWLHDRTCDNYGIGYDAAWKETFHRGWPFWWCNSHRFVNWAGENREVDWHAAPLLGDAMIAFSGICLFAFVFERWFIRRREVRKP